MVLRAECEAYNCRNRTNNKNNVYLHRIYSKLPSTNEKKDTMLKLEVGDG